MSEPRSQSTARGANSGSAALYLRTLRATPHMSVETEQVVIEVDGGVMGAYLTRPAARGPRRAVIVAHELFALNVDIRRVVDTQIGAIRAALEAAAVRHQVSVLPGAPHAFFWGDTANLSRSLTQRRLATLERIVRRRWRRPENLIFDGHLAWPFASQPSASRLRAARDALPAPLLGARTTPPPVGYSPACGKGPLAQSIDLAPEASRLSRLVTSFCVDFGWLKARPTMNTWSRRITLCSHYMVFIGERRHWSATGVRCRFRKPRCDESRVPAGVVAPRLHTPSVCAFVAPRHPGASTAIFDRLSHFAGPRHALGEASEHSGIAGTAPPAPRVALGLERRIPGLRTAARCAARSRGRLPPAKGLPRARPACGLATIVAQSRPTRAANSRDVPTSCFGFKSAEAGY